MIYFCTIVIIDIPKLNPIKLEFSDSLVLFCWMLFLLFWHDKLLWFIKIQHKCSNLLHKCFCKTVPCSLQYALICLNISLRICRTVTTPTAGARNKGGNFIGQLCISIIPHCAYYIQLVTNCPMSKVAPLIRLLPLSLGSSG